MRVPNLTSEALVTATQLGLPAESLLAGGIGSAWSSTCRRCDDKAELRPRERAGATACGSGYVAPESVTASAEVG